MHLTRRNAAYEREDGRTTARIYYRAARKDASPLAALAFVGTTAHARLKADSIPPGSSRAQLSAMLEWANEHAMTAMRLQARRYPTRRD